MDNQLRNKAKELLQSGQVKTVIGYEAGSTPFKSTPLFASTPEEADRLVWNPTCVNNLAVYLPQAVKQGRVAVALKPCDAGSVVELLKEHQVRREDVLVIVMSCPGVMGDKMLDGINPRDVRSVDWNGGGISVRTADGEVSVKDAFAPKCLTCDHADPTVMDIKVGEAQISEPLRDPYMDLAEYEKLSPAERRAFWSEQFSKCIRCYACRSACPGCYCRECFVDKPAQMWASKATDAESNWFFHMVRAMHLAGRCVGCGECERVCPMNIPLSLLNKRMAKDVAEMFNCEPGADPEAAPALGCFTMHDPDPCPE